MHESLKSCGLPVSAVELVQDTSRESVAEVLNLKGVLDLLIPRGGAGLIQHVVEHARVPVVETGAGNCHLYIARSAEPQMAIEIALNAKVQRPSVCNAIETILVDEQWAEKHLASLVEAMKAANVECRGCRLCQALCSAVVPAVDADWDTEFLDYVVAIRVMESLEAAIDHINSHGTHHSEAIVTTSNEERDSFFAGVDSAALYHNASTRFTDGFQYGFGAEIGISTQKLHARGPMGLAELTSYQYRGLGNGQIRS